MTLPFHTLMVQGTTSDAGKSTIVAALCRLIKRRGVTVAPFKPQNMALNSAVTADGGEIGRAQALQAMACGIAPHTDMNPVLLKPSSNTGAQVIIHGKVRAEMDARDYQQYKTIAMGAVLESYARLRQQYQAVIVEGEVRRGQTGSGGDRWRLQTTNQSLRADLERLKKPAAKVDDLAPVIDKLRKQLQVRLSSPFCSF